MTVREAINEAMKFQQARQFAQAEAIYRQLLASHPNQPDVLHLLGVLKYMSGDAAEAIEWIGRAISFRPDFLEAKVNLGAAYQQVGRLDEAIEAYQAALKINPNLAGIYNNLGNALQAGEKTEEAVAAYRRSLELDPKLSETHGNLGNVLKSTGRVEEAIQSYRTALVLRPDHPQTLCHLSAALLDRGEAEQALACAERAIQLHADLADGHSHLGNALLALRRVDESIDAYRCSIALKPDYAQTHASLGIALAENGLLDEAIETYRRAIALKPDLPEAFNNLGSALVKLCRLDEAIEAYRKAMALRPADAATHSNLIVMLHYHPDYDAGKIAEELAEWDRRHGEPRRKLIQPNNNERNVDRKLRIGYVSPDFRRHVVGQNLLPLFHHHDHGGFEIVCYSNVPVADEMTAEFQKHCDQWRNITGVCDEEVVRQIRDDKIDVLVDLAMHTGHNRLTVFAHKPAPVQVTAFAYPGSTGLAAIDYRLSDPYLDPPEMFEEFSSEKTIRIPDSFWCYEPAGMEVGPLPAEANGHITFGCLNNFCKISDASLKLWAAALAEVKDSRILVLAPEGSARERIMRMLAVGPDRVQLLARQPRNKYFELYHRIDIGLDTVPYNGHTTSLDSFWMGVPVVTMIGKTVVGRAGWCQSCNLGLKELAAENEEWFIQIAAKLAADRDRLKVLRAGMRQRMKSSPLMDGARFARNIEATYRQMWRDWVARSV